MIKEKYPCRFCYFVTSSFKIAEEHFLSKHRKKEKAIQKNQKNKKTKNIIKVKPKQKKIKTCTIKEKTFKDISEKRKDYLIINKTKSEKKLKNKLDNKYPNLFEFQKIIYLPNGNFFILDFYCDKYKLGIELDGKQHLQKENKKYDEKSKLLLNIKKIKIIRFSNRQIWDNFNEVLLKIDKLLFPSLNYYKFKEKTGSFLIKKDTSMSTETITASYEWGRVK